MEKTNWDAYYDRPFVASSVTRRYTSGVLIRYIRQAMKGRKEFTLCEIGGANSCFYDAIRQTFEPRHYSIVDNNQLGLDKFAERMQPGAPVSLSLQDILSPQTVGSADLVFSVGLIEHFDPAGTKLCINNHLQFLSKPGYLILSFPTPTWLYRVTRFCAEALGIWKFPDERPLMPEEVIAALAGKGKVISQEILWPIVLTQCMILFEIE